MSMQQQIEAKLAAALSPSHLEVINESYMHRVAPGSESHFKVVVVSQAFEGQRLLGRHRQVNGGAGRRAGGSHSCIGAAYLYRIRVAGQGAGAKDAGLRQQIPLCVSRWTF